MLRRFLNNRKDNFAHAHRREDETEVQNGLAMTPAQMYDMAMKGLPISTQNLGITYDEGYSNLDFTPPLEYQRGIDLGDLYEARMDAKQKLRANRDAGRFQSAAVTESN